MPMNLDAYLGVHADALKLRSQRTEILARNLANADSISGDPSTVYKARHPIFEAVRSSLSQPDGGNEDFTASKIG